MRKEKPTPDREYHCQAGMNPFPIMLRREKAKLELKGQKEVAGRMTFVIRAEVPDQPGWRTYYLDSENYLLLRLDSRQGPMHSTTLYSDYRDVAGIKVAFQTESHSENSDLVTKLQECASQRSNRRPGFPQTELVSERGPGDGGCLA